MAYDHDQLLSVSSANQWKEEFTYDGRGRMRVRKDGNGNVTMRVGTGSPTIKGYYRYDPFGRTLASGGSLAGVNAMRFSSKPAMGSSDLYYYGYRFYDPSSQRWLNRDPLGEEGGQNLYVHVSNNPIIKYDALGLLTDEQIESMINSGAAGGAFAGALIGGIVGGCGGALLGLPTGPGAVATGGAGVAGGIAAGTGIGAAVGAMAGAGTAAAIHLMQKLWDEDSENLDCDSKGYQKMPQRNNQHPNAQFNEALKQLGIPKGSDKANRLHRYISKQRKKTVDEIKEAAEELGL